MKSPEELRAIAEQCRSLAGHCMTKTVQSNLRDMASYFDREAHHREVRHETLGSGRY